MSKRQSGDRILSSVPSATARHGRVCVKKQSPQSGHLKPATSGLSYWKFVLEADEEFETKPDPVRNLHELSWIRVKSLGTGVLLQHRVTR